MDSSKNIRLVIFDMDGLLVDSEKVYQRAWIEAAKAFEIKVSEKVVGNLAGHGLLETENALLEAGVALEDVKRMRRFREDYIRVETDQGRMEEKPFAKLLLAKLKARGYLTGLASSSPAQRASRILAKLDLLQYIDFPVYGEEIAHQKPAADPYLEVLRRANITNRQEALIVEDSLTGIAAARAAEIAVIQIPDSSIKSAQVDQTGYIARTGSTLEVVLDFLEIRD